MRHSSPVRLVNNSTSEQEVSMQSQQPPIIPEKPAHLKNGVSLSMRPPSVNQTPYVEFKPTELGWFEDSQKNKPQSNSLAAAAAIFASGGMSLAWSLGFSAETTKIDKAHIQVCWFIAVIIGACLGTLLIGILQKRVLNLWASGLITINGVLFVSAPESTVALTFGRYCDGFAVGMTIIAATIAGSEQAVKRFRGLVLTAESIGLGIGIMLKTIFISLWNASWPVNSNQIQGILSLILGLLALLCTIFLTIESPVFYLRRDRENDAEDVLRRLQNHSSSNETFTLLYENKNLISEDNQRGLLLNIKAGLLPFIKVCLYRTLVSMSFSLPLNWGLLLASSLVGEDSEWQWSSFIYGIMRITGIIITVFTVDTVGRKEPTAMTMFIGGGLLTGIGSIFSNPDNLDDVGLMQTAIALLSVYQLLIAVATPVSSVYLGEAFSVSVKQFFILAVVIVENVVQIIICCAFEGTATSVADYSFTLGAFQIVFGICFIIVMPETKKTTLREALEKFKNKINIDYK